LIHLPTGKRIADGGEGKQPQILPGKPRALGLRAAWEALKSETRNPKPGRSPITEIRITWRCRTVSICHNGCGLGLRASAFGFPSAFGLRVLDFSALKGAGWTGS